MWILTYDEGCVECRQIAAAVRQESRDRLEVASLRDPRVITSLKRSRKSMSRPTLINLEAEAQVLQGAALGWRLARLVGLRRATRILRLIGEERQRSSDSSSLTRRLLLIGGGKLTLGTLVAGGALASASPAHASSDQTGDGSAGWHRVLGRHALQKQMDECTTAPAVAKLVRELQRSGYGGYDELPSTIVAAADTHGKTITWLPMWHAPTATLAIIDFRSWRPEEPRVALLQELNGRVQRAPMAPGAMSRTVAPAINWSCWAGCVASTCPTCMQGCIFTGPLWPQCVLDCCGVGFVACITFFC